MDVRLWHLADIATARYAMASESYSKTVVRVTVPWVRLPPSPPYHIDLQGFAGLFYFQSINRSMLTLPLRPWDPAMLAKPNAVEKPRTGNEGRGFSGSGWGEPVTEGSAVTIT